MLMGEGWVGMVDEEGLRSVWCVCSISSRPMTLHPSDAHAKEKGTHGGRHPPAAPSAYGAAARRTAS